MKKDKEEGLHEVTEEARTHFETASLLMKGLEQSLKYAKDHPGYYGTREHSAASIKRRCLQIRQELLLVEKGVSSELYG